MRSIAIANAGSGKTFTLANRVIAWSVAELRAGRAPEPERLLAVTFTRKAAAEILARVLLHAARGALDASARQEFGALLGAGEPVPTAEEYRKVLEALCASLHRLSIGTIDGYFHRVASAMPAELGLPPEWTVGDPAELAELRAEVAADLLGHERAAEFIAQLELGAPKASAMAALLEVLGTERGGRTSTQSLLDIYRATVMGARDGRERDERVERAWHWAAPLAEEYPRLSRDAWATLAERLERADLPRKDDGTPRVVWENARTKIAGLLRQGDCLQLAKETLIANISRGATFDRVDAPDEVKVLVGEIVAAMRAEFLHLIAQRMEAAAEVLPAADASLREAQAAGGMYGFGDLTSRIASASADGAPLSDPAAVSAALGVSVRDLAIDEAQDTSVDQYRSLLPLVRAVLAGGGEGRFLLVGDTKQSIYGWRGGTPGLVEAIRDEFEHALGADERLAVSYRSSPLVLGFVNTVFGDLAKTLVPLARPDDAEELVELASFVDKRGLQPSFTANPLARAVAQWKFERHEAAKDLPGRVYAYLVGTEKPEKPAAKSRKKKGADDAAAADAPGDAATPAAPAREPVELPPEECAASIAERISREFPARTVAILTRTNKEVADVVAKLRARGIDASDEGRSTLLDSPAAVGIVMLLRLVDDPGDRVAHFMVSRGAMAAVSGLRPVESHASTAEALDAAAALARTLRAEAVDRGLPALVGRLSAALLEQGVSARDALRLGRLRAIAEQFALRTPARMREYLRAVEQDTADASSTCKVRVMTVHKSKGLEFDEVVLLALDQGWGQKLPNWGVLANGPKHPPALVAPLWNEEVRQRVPELELFAREERRRRMLDELSAFYVALTRAKHGIHLLFDIASVASGPSSAELLKRALAACSAANGDAAEGADTRFGGFTSAIAAVSVPSDEPFWKVEHADTAAVRAPGHRAAAPRSTLSGDALLAPGRRAQVAAAPSSAAGGGGTEPQEGGDGDEAASEPTELPLWALSPFDDGDIALRGVLVHECFRDMRAIDEFASAAARTAAVAAATARAEVDKCEPVAAGLASEVEELLAQLASPASAVGRTLRPSDRETVRAEVPFVSERADGSLIRGRIDRLVLRVEQGRVVGAHIIDFKTGAKKHSRARMQALVEHYGEQLAAYQAAVAALWSLDPSTVTAALLFVDRDEVVELGALATA